MTESTNNSGCFDCLSEKERSRCPVQRRFSKRKKKCSYAASSVRRKDIQTRHGFRPVTWTEIFQPALCSLTMT